MFDDGRFDSAIPIICPELARLYGAKENEIVYELSDSDKEYIDRKGMKEYLKYASSFYGDWYVDYWLEKESIRLKK